MRFLVDAQLPPALARRIQSLGHDAEHVADCGLSTATDAEIRTQAEKTGAALVTKDDPAIYLSFSAPPHMGQAEKDPTHTANFGVKLQEHCKEIGVPCELYYPGATDAKHPSSEAFLIEKLKAPPAK